MKIREIRVQNFRNFGPELRSVKFYDEATGLVRPISVLVGSNGCGKTTLLEIVVGFLTSACGEKNLLVHSSRLSYLQNELFETGTAVFELALESQNVPPDLRDPVWLGMAPSDTAKRLRGGVLPNEWEDPRTMGDASPLSDELREWLHGRRDDGEFFEGGVLYFPHNRWMEHVQRDVIKKPHSRRPWVFCFNAASKWEGSLSQFWVWQNYLDLEQGREGRPNLAPFVEAIEEILGRGRKVRIKEGRVRIERPDLGDSVELHELPSGEQQILTIFGEIIRMLRPGAVILIDEVEISLHPALQRAVLFHLRRLAAKYDLQIIMTTHSMEIVSAVAPEEVVNLDDMSVVEQRRTAEEP